MGTAVNLKKANKTGTEPVKINLEAFSPHFKFLNFNDIIGIFEIISHDRNSMIAKSI